MEEVFFRFSHLSENIFQLLNSESLAKSKEVCISWYQYLDDQKFLHARANKVKSVIETVKKLGHVQKDHSRKNMLNIKTSKEIIDDARNWNFDLVHDKIMKSINSMYVGTSYSSTYFYHGHPFFIAAFEGHFEVVKYLVDNLEDKNPKSNLHFGSTPLHIAAGTLQSKYSAICKNRINVLKYIMSKVSDINPKDNFGNTPLHYAARGGQLQCYGRLAVFKYIIENIAEKNPSNNNGKTPIDLACAKRDWEIVKIATKYWPFSNQ